ncbi:GtrA family protein [Saccharopolyspora phatthalungensis]|uniref:Putative flippase GtrA n=1 Tax=Saccharopolyspora phatthalungensis TaxID=664693 RepID=A0A840Q2G8_9PSEU|nr:GtrA family protein [Saccharopolyspora phatthalungensis]MBB5156712.1 putative flippase GtrA [Saccharopolyspora phatthalungensis]
MWRKTSRSELLRFALVGGVNTAVHCTVYLALWLLLPYLPAHLIATVVATVCSYLLNCRFTFGVVPNRRTLLLFPLSNLAMIGLSTAVVAASVEVFGVDPVLAPIAAGLVVVPATFLLSKAVLTERLPRGEWRGAVGVGVVVALLSQIPAMVNPSFYFWDDSAAQFLPMWHRLGERLLAGDWPLGLDLDSWMGGNLAAESLFGIWNPVHLLDCLLVVWLGDLAIAATVVKTQFLVTLGVGTFLLCRDYRAKRDVASVLAVALPLSGFVLYFQAATWAGGLMGFAWLPWAWWALRRLQAGRIPAFVPWLLCYLCVSAGDPYGVLALAAVFAGLFIETGRDWSRVRRLGLVGIAVTATLPLIFFPVLAAAEVGWRSGHELFNIGQLVPGVGDLLNASMPSFVPQILSFGTFRMSVPATYFAWFAIPLLAWLDWRSAGASWRRCGCAVALAGCYFLLCLGPSNVWLFRWPVRHVAVLHLAVAVLLSVALSRGLRTDHFKVRLACSAGSLLLGGYLSFAAWPAQAPKHLVSLGMIAVLCAAVVIVHRKRLKAAVLHLGTVCALALQMAWFPANRDVAVYNFPTSIAQLRSDYAEFDGGTVVQLAERDLIPSADIASRAAWSQLLFGNMHAAAGVASLVAYTGIGYNALHTRLCLSYYGATCPQAYDRLWEPDGLVDQLKATHVVVQRRLREVPEAPAGWRISRRDRDVVVLSRKSALPWPHGRLSASRGVHVLDDVQHGQRRETVRFGRTGGPAELVFARLAWPGYQAAVDGRRVRVDGTDAGLLLVRVPPGVPGGALTLSWSPPGFTAHLLLACAGALLAIVLSVVSPLRRRQPR